MFTHCMCFPFLHFQGPSTYSQDPRSTSTGCLGGGEGVRESQDLDVRVEKLGQDQNNMLKETHFTHVDNRAWREKRTAVENENKLDAGVIYVV